MKEFVFRLPDVGEGTAEAELVAWHVAPGDQVREDQPLVDVMTDKATVEITSPVAGRVIKLGAEVGAMAAVGAPLLVLEVEDRGQGSATVGVPAQASAQPAAAAAPPPPPPPPGRRALASPAVRRKAQELGIDLQAVVGSGPGGRVVHEDLERPVSPADPRPGGPEVTEVKLVGLRRKIAAQMQESKRRIPHFGYVEEIDVTELESLRAWLNGNRQAGQPKLTLLPFLIRALCNAITRFPEMNARFDDEAGVISRYRPVNMGMATQTPAGLVVPVIRDADSRDLWNLAAEITRLAEAARAGKAAAHELSGSTITLSSMGPLSGVVSVPVINHPEVCIVCPNKIQDKVVPRDGSFAVRKVMNLSSACDHRVIDGWDAARFVQDVKGQLEHPATLFVAWKP